MHDKHKLPISIHWSPVSHINGVSESREGITFPQTPLTVLNCASIRKQSNIDRDTKLPLTNKP